MTWRQLSMLIGQFSLAGFGAHMVWTRQMTPTLGLGFVAGIVVLAVIGGEGVAGGNILVNGLRAWRWRGARRVPPAAAVPTADNIPVLSPAPDVEDLPRIRGEPIDRRGPQ